MSPVSGITSRSPSKRSPRASSNTSTAPRRAAGAAGTRRKAMARILLGVSGGIAAYKALELARLASRAGHGVRVLMTEGATRFVGAASFEGIVGAPVLTSEFEHDPMRGGFPGEGQPGHDPIGHLELAGNCDAYLVAP